MKKVYQQRLVKLIALIVPIVLIVLLLQNYLFVYRDANTVRIDKFYCEPKDSLDVVFLGASELTTGYAPGYAYGKYGYTSYLYAIDGNLGTLYTAQLKEILSQQNPELIFVDPYGFTKFKDDLYDSVKLRQFTENIPDSCSKLETIFDFQCDNKISYLFPFMKYHGDMQTAKQQLQYLSLPAEVRHDPSLGKGVLTFTTRNPGPGDDGVIDGTNDRLDPEGEACLVEFLEFCKQEKLENVVFVNFPRQFQNESTSDLLSRLGHARQIIEEYSFEYLDFQQVVEDIGLDFYDDFYNCHHMNAYGQQKFTDYLGSMIIDRYQVTPREQSAENRTLWEESAKVTEGYFLRAREEIEAGNEIWIYGDADILLLSDE